MSEMYTIHVDGNRLRFEPRQDGALEGLAAQGAHPAGHEAVSRMGDPGLLHCAVFRRNEGQGGLFVLHDQDGLLFAAVAESNLAYALAQGFFGRMVSEARYGADIFENMDDADERLASCGHPSSGGGLFSGL
ncbi:hypothetical protein [uncultured Desulfovibrio sp.]|uniref:hypothetical protein n=2 Tax=uncultured Desulfovibrio sp. TaxID=167968 RepID=UPI00272B265D|nr:hypothetical protein [uncultured Desulfovibrio sp.]